MDEIIIGETINPFLLANGNIIRLTEFFNEPKMRSAWVYFPHDPTFPDVIITNDLVIIDSFWNFLDGHYRRKKNQILKRVNRRNPTLLTEIGDDL